MPKKTSIRDKIKAEHAPKIKPKKSVPQRTNLPRTKESAEKLVKIVKKKGKPPRKEYDAVKIADNAVELIAIGAEVKRKEKEAQEEAERLAKIAEKQLRKELQTHDKLQSTILMLNALIEKCEHHGGQIRSVFACLDYCDFVYAIDDFYGKLQTIKADNEYYSALKEAYNTFLPTAIEYAKIVKEFWLDIRENNEHFKYNVFKAQYKQCCEDNDKAAYFEQICRDKMRITNGGIYDYLNKSYCACFDVLARTFDVDSYLIALEWNRKEQDKFYLPRRQCFMNMETVDNEKFSIIADAQEYIDGDLDLVFTSMPQRCGKSTIGLLVQSLLIQKDLEKSIFGIGHSAGLAQHFYNQVYNIINDKNTYRYFDIFKGQKCFKTSAENYTLDLNKAHAFPNFTFRSIDGNITGSTEASLAAYADDLIKDAQEIINPETADKIWSKTNTLILGRMKNNVRFYGTGTLWGDNCPFTRLISEIEKMCDSGLYDRSRIRIRRLAWHNSNGESQFDYKYNLGFSTKHFRRLEATMSVADYPLWCAMYLSQPISRDGRPLQALKYFDELPKEKHDYVGMAIDVALGSGDYYSACIGYVYEKKQEVYFVDVIHSKKDTDFTLPYTVDKILEYKVETVAVEEKEPAPKNSYLRFGIGEMIHKLAMQKNHICNVESKSAAGESSKQMRILGAKGAILAMDLEGTDYKFYYLSAVARKGNVQYDNFIREIQHWSEEKAAQKRQQDGAPDCLALFRTRILKLRPRNTTAEIFSIKGLV